MENKKDEPINGGKFDVLGGIFKTFELPKWELEMFSKFLDNPFDCNIIGNMKRYSSNILDDWVNYKPKQLDWITHVDTFKFWWSYTKDTSFETFVRAVNLEQYEIADLCIKIPSDGQFKWPRSELNEIKDSKKYLSYIDKYWIHSSFTVDYLEQFPLNAIKYLLQNSMENGRKIRNIVTAQVLINKNLIDLLPFLEIRDTYINFNRDMLKKADILIKHGITMNYHSQNTISLSDSEIETLLSISPGIKYGDADAIYRIESIRRKMIAECTIINNKYNHYKYLTDAEFERNDSNIANVKDSEN